MLCAREGATHPPARVDDWLEARETILGWAGYKLARRGLILSPLLLWGGVSLFSEEAKSINKS